MSYALYIYDNAAYFVFYVATIL